LKPILQIMKGGIDLMPGMASTFLSATFTDNVGEEDDEFEIELDDNWRQIPLPQEDDLLIPFAGWEPGTVSMLGAFKVNGWDSGCQSGPETMTVTARAATMASEFKAGGLKHWDDSTLGDVLQDTAKAAKLALAIDPELAKVKLPYTLRWENSPVDFAHRVAAESGGIVKPAGEKLVVSKRGSGKGASGAELPPILISRIGCSGWRINGEPRPRYGSVVASWHDPKTGKRKSIRYSTGSKGPAHTLLHPRPSEDEAKRAAEARGRALNMLTGGGHFTMPFNPAWSAGAKVVASDFGDGIDGEWCSESISTTWAKGSPVLSTITVKAKPEGKSAGGDT
jgi:phage protein D